MQNRSGGRVEYNTTIQCPVGIFTDRAVDDGGSTAGLTRVRQNLVLHGLWMGNCPASSGANWGIDLGSLLEEGTPVEENIIAHNIDKQGSLMALREDGENCTYRDNIIYDWIESEDMWNDSWTDPERDIESYTAQAGLGASLEDYTEAQRNRAVYEWPQNLTSYALINYIREGFSMQEIEPEPLTLGNQNTDISLTIYPNPANDALIVQLADQNLNELTQLRLYSAGGKLVKVINPKNLDSNGKLSVYTGDLDAGMYLLQGELKTGKPLRYQIVVMH